MSTILWSTDAQDFLECITKAKAIHKYGSSVYVYPIDDYETMQLYVTRDGSMGYALKGPDIVSVFSMSDKYTLEQLINHAIIAGGCKLDCYDTILPALYKQHGFKEVARDSWNDNYKPDDWNKALYSKFNNGEPDVVYMELVA